MSSRPSSRNFMQPRSPEKANVQEGMAATAIPSSASRRTGSSWEPLLYLAPGLLIFTAFVTMPAIAAVALSLTAWNGVSWNTAHFVGIDNYRDAFGDHLFWTSLRHNLIL